MQPVVGVEHEYKLAGAMAQAGVTRRCKALSGLLNERYLLPETLRNHCRVVGGAIIDNNDLEGTVSLLKHATDRLIQKLTMVIAGDYNRDQPGFGTISRAIPVTYSVYQTIAPTESPDQRHTCPRQPDIRKSGVSSLRENSLLCQDQSCLWRLAVS
jgi:hypothetical protein